MAIRINYGKIKENQMAKKETKESANKPNVGDDVYFVERKVNDSGFFMAPEIDSVTYQVGWGMLISIDNEKAVINAPSGWFSKSLRQIPSEYVFTNRKEVNKFLSGK